MSDQLHPYLPFDHVETTESYLRRLSEFHTGRDRRALLADFGIDLRDFASGTDDALSKMAAITGVDAKVLKAGLFLFRPRYREFRDEVVSIEFLRCEGAMICPECIREDAQDDHPWLFKERVLWRLRPVQTCLEHGCRLISTLDAATSTEPSKSFTAHFRNCHQDPTAQAPTALETNILNRLLGAATGAGSWLDSQTIEQGVKVCEMIGATLMHGLKFKGRMLTDEDWRQAGNNGFSIARGGAGAVMTALSDVASMSTTTAGQAGPKAVYGRLYEWLAYNSPVPDPGPIRGLLRENILDTLVVEPDEVLLGERVEGRRLHSVYSLSLKTGLHQKRLRKILVQAGLADNDTWDLAAHRLVFPVAQAEELCADIINSVSLHQLPEAIGCSRTQAESLHREGVLRPVIDTSVAFGIGKLAFSRRDLNSFLSRINSLPVVPLANGDLVDLVSAAKITGRSTGDLVTLIFLRNVEAYRHGNVPSVGGIRFSISDLDRIRTRKPRSLAKHG